MPVREATQFQQVAKTATRTCHACVCSMLPWHLKSLRADHPVSNDTVFTAGDQRRPIYAAQCSASFGAVRPGSNVLCGRASITHFESDETQRDGSVHPIEVQTSLG